jgi:hypothetical protein
MKGLYNRVLLAAVVASVVLPIVLLAQTNRRRYVQLDLAWSQPGRPMTVLVAQSQLLAARSSDRNLQRVGEFLGALAAALHQGGFKNLAQVKPGGLPDSLLSGFAGDVVNPMDWLVGLPDTGWLKENERGFRASLALAGKRYGGLNVPAVVLPILAGLGTGLFLGIRKRPAGLAT